ncbi:TPA: glycosyltransferase [Serratia marcescens]|nr:glycosyltransferase family 1 protein [Serratia nematodiphila]HEI8821193.1 glycosyltransferase [Serratia marcescens]
MKIFHAAETIKGGVATVMRQIAIHQEKNENVSRMICLVPEDQASELSPLDMSNIVTFKRTGRNLLSFVAFTKRFVQLVLKDKPDIVHLHSTFSGVLGRLALIFLWPVRRPKVVYCPHAFSFIIPGSSAKRKAYAFVEVILSKITDAIICVSEYERQQGISHGLPENKLVVVYNGVPQVKGVQQAYKNPYPEGVTNLLFVGRFDYQKGFDILELTMGILKGKPFHLTAIGGSVHGSYVENKELPQTSYTGWLSADELIPYFTHADILVIPSRWEGFAMVPLEAMSYGLPVVASDSTSLPEVVTDGITGKLFPLSRPEALAELLSVYSASDWRIMGENAREEFLRKFTSKKMLSNTDKVYQAIIPSMKI